VKELMKNQPLRTGSPVRASLDQRLAHNPALAEAFHALIDEMDHSLQEGSSADDVEERVQAGVRVVGQEALVHWAQQAHDAASQSLPREKPGAVKHAKKNSAGKRSSATSKSRSRSGG
jgi:hypothetical protein